MATHELVPADDAVSFPSVLKSRFSTYHLSRPTHWMALMLNATPTTGLRAWASLSAKL